jgi:drug/metabolite transporter (DMT)-like permease
VTSIPTTAAVDERGGFEWKTELALWIVVVTWASTWIALKDAFDYIAPLAFLLIRFLLMNLLAFGVLAVRVRRGNAHWSIRRADAPLLIASGLSGYTFYQVSAVLGLDRSSVFTLSLLVAMSPFFTMTILTALGEKPSAYGWIGFAVAAVGVVIFLSDKRSGGDTLLGAGLSLCAGLAMAVYGIVNRPLTLTYPRETYTAYSLLFGTIPMLAICGPATLGQDWSGVPIHVWVGLAYLVVVPVYIAYQLWNYAIARRGAGPVSAYNLIVPILSGVLSAIAFHERFSWLKIAGAALALFGLLIPKLKPGATRG